MTQTIRRKNCKTRREWADKKALKFWHGHRGGLSDYGAKLLMMEHARAVRIVKRLQRNAECGGFGLAYGVALKDVLAALYTGRA